MFIITTNGVIGDSGELVMGTGIAKEASKKIKGISKICGEKILEKGTPASDSYYNYKYFYYFLPILENEDKNHFGIFQVKLDWKNKASIDIIEKSCQKLVKYMDNHSSTTFRMNYPGIGAGKLSRHEVEPILEKYFLNRDITFCTR